MQRILTVTAKTKEKFEEHFVDIDTLRLAFHFQHLRILRLHQV